MKAINIILGFLVIPISLIAGFLSSYTFTLIIFILLFIFNFTNFLIKKRKQKLKFIFFGISLFSFILLFHTGLLIRNSLRQVCFNSIPKNKTDSKFNFRPISIENLEKNIFSHNAFKIDTIKSINFNKKEYYIKKLSPKKRTGNKTKVLILAGMHGSETANVYAILKILESIKNKKLLEEFHFEIIYDLNPVGLTLFNRLNECNCDINRDFILFKTVQSNLLKDLVANVNFDYVLDLHEGPYGGQYIMNNTSLKNLNSDIKNKLEEENILVSPMLKNKLKDFLFRYELDNSMTKFNKIMPFDSYLNELGIENILSESDGLSNNFDERVKGHLVVFHTLIESIQE